MEKEEKNKQQKVYSPRLTPANEIFINALIRGDSQRQAYLKAYPKRKKWKTTSLDCEASKLARNPKIRQRHLQLLEEIRLEEQSATRWTREESIKTLRNLIDLNQKEIERINTAFDEELEMIIAQLKDAHASNDVDAANKAINAMFARRKSRRISNTFNQGVIGAVAELNKMQGFNEENINLNGTVQFFGEDELED